MHLGARQRQQLDDVSGKSHDVALTITGHSDAVDEPAQDPSCFGACLGVAQRTMQVGNLLTVYVGSVSV
jgi:hypothetical protein